MKTDCPSIYYLFLSQYSIFLRGEMNPAAGITPTRKTPNKYQFSLCLKWWVALVIKQFTVLRSIRFQRLLEKITIREMAPNYLPATILLTRFIPLYTPCDIAGHSSCLNKKDFLFAPQRKKCFKIIR